MYNTKHKLEKGNQTNIHIEYKYGNIYFTFFTKNTSTISNITNINIPYVDFLKFVTHQRIRT